MKRGRMSPRTMLIVELRSAAQQIASPQFRQAAAMSAAKIPITRAERFNRGAYGRLARAARATLVGLHTLDPAEHAATAQLLRDFADALATPRHQVRISESVLGGREFPRGSKRVGAA